MDTSNLLAEIKLLKGIKDNIQDDLITLIIQDSIERISSYVNQVREVPIEILPDEISYVVRDVAIKRFNRLNSEGTKSDSEEGRSFVWEDGYLDEYKAILANLTDRVKYRAKGIARFIC